MLGGGIEEGKIPCSLPSSLGRREAGITIMKMVELVMSLTCCSTHKSRPYSLPGQQVRTGTGSWIHGELAQRA